MVDHSRTSQTVMPFDFQPVLTGKLLELRPLRDEDFDDLFAVAADPLIWEQHPVKDRYQHEHFRIFFREALESGGTLIAIDTGRADLYWSHMGLRGRSKRAPLGTMEDQ